MALVDQAARTPGDDARFRAARASDGRAVRIEVFPRIITVSREFGAGGGRIAGRVAAELGFQLWDDELIARLARKAGTELAAVREVDERERDLLDELIASSLPRGCISGSRYRMLLTRVVAELAERGDAVIVGRGANFLVQPEQALRVRVVCPLRLRIDRHALRECFDRASAERVVRARDRERARFVHQLCGENPADPTHYDLLINTAELCEEAAARLIVACYYGRFQAVTREGDRQPALRA